MVIGLTGKNGSGKGEVAQFLKERSFDYLSLSDVLREELKTSGQEVTRENLIRIGRDLRSRYGAGVLAERVLKRLETDRNYVVDSIRNPAEADVLRHRKDFTLVEVAASARVRFERMRVRARESDPMTFGDFVKLEEREAKRADFAAQALDETAAQADRVLKNEGTLEELRRGVTELVQELSRIMPRPDWDEYFMGIARVVALRSNCIKRKVAAVVVKDRRVISTGYNGTPRGVTNCNEGGCPRCNELAETGKGLDQCLCNHAEENAITQSAYHGVGLKGSTLYTTFAPCLLCTKMIINSGIVEVVYQRQYTIEDVPFKLLRQAGVSARQIASSR
ncbi:MAG: AAA family ATPase [Candidatus Omnitrophica bacterium]|nr:AAA family ATPase [Candidatus Omnitrophota bacterium]